MGEPHLRAGEVEPAGEPDEGAVVAGTADPRFLAEHVAGKAGLADLGEPELGAFSLAEMEAVELPFGLGIERDILFEGAFPLSVYAQAARTAGRIVIDDRSLRAAAAEFILEGLYAQKRISRNEQQAFTASERPSRPERTEEDFRKGFDPRRGQGGGRRNLN